MRLRLYLAFLALLGAAACMSQPDYRADPEPPPTVAEVDLERYAGRWFEIARYPNWFERGCLESEANYALLPEGRVSVVNTCLHESGKVKKAEGRARVVDGSGGARLKVKFAPQWVPFAEGDYWVLHLEPDYSLVLVGEPRGKYLWILAREKSPDAAAVDRALARAQELGFETEPLDFASERPAP